MTSPSSGVNPIEVSTDFPLAIAATEQPLPNCTVMRLHSFKDFPVKAA
jgi:hypothetical protein